VNSTIFRLDLIEFDWISNDKDYSKFNSSCCILRLTIAKKITSIKSYSWRAFQQYHECSSISQKIVFFILLNFQWQNGSIFNNSWFVCLNITKPPLCTPTQQGLCNSIKNMAGGSEILTWWTNRWNKLPSLEDRYQLLCHIDFHIVWSINIKV
jgi:hypothetical protein